MEFGDHILPARLGANLPEGIRVVTDETGCRAFPYPGGYEVRLLSLNGGEASVRIPDGTPDSTVLEAVQIHAANLANRKGSLTLHVLDTEAPAVTVNNAAALGEAGMVAEDGLPGGNASEGHDSTDEPHATDPATE